MGLFSKLFNKTKSNDKDATIIYAEPDTLMEQASQQAKDTFKYFWRELNWEYRRIIPAHDFAMVKIPFTQLFQGDNEPIVEHMWINEINFDGNTITGVLVNDPNQITNINKMDEVKRGIGEISDWMLSIGGKTHGGFTIQAMRSQMSEAERQQHDAAWGLDFGDYNDILWVHDQKSHPEHLIEHPMSINMKDKMRDYLESEPDSLTHVDALGQNLLHKEAIAGNKTHVEILLELGMNKSLKCSNGKTALDYAISMGWEHVEAVLK